jgi:hypothetical protein
VSLNSLLPARRRRCRVRSVLLFPQRPASQMITLNVAVHTLLRRLAVELWVLVSAPFEILFLNLDGRAMLLNPAVVAQRLDSPGDSPACNATRDAEPAERQRFARRGLLAGPERIRANLGGHMQHGHRCANGRQLVARALVDARNIRGQPSGEVPWPANCARRSARYEAASNKRLREQGRSGPRGDQQWFDELCHDLG